MAVVVKADGVSEAFYNGQRDRVVEAIREDANARVAQVEKEAAEERERLTAQLETACDNADMQYAGRVKALTAKLDALKTSLTGRRGPVKRALRRIENAWAMLWALTFGGAWVDVGETLGLWERVENDETER